jgi:pSer/pThr/pTyr-binding forkhead associated (FHA) protein
VPPFVLTVLKIALLVLLYFFVWRAVRTVVGDLYGPRETRRRARSPQPKARPAGRRKVPTKLFVLDEKGRKTATHRLGGTLQVGRAPTCQIRLDDNYISQLHAKISERNGAWVVEDLGSTNGTYLNQRKVSAPAEISAGDRIRVGKTVLEVRR